jgi:hypothetical protein
VTTGDKNARVGNREDAGRVCADRAVRYTRFCATGGEGFDPAHGTGNRARRFQRAHELSKGNPRAGADLANVFLKRNRFAEAEAIIAQALPAGASGRLLVFDLIIKTQWRGDLASAAAALAVWPEWLLLEDRGAILAWRTWLWSRRPERALLVAQRFQRDYVSDWRFIGPRAALTARAHEGAGHLEAAGL